MTSIYREDHGTYCRTLQHASAPLATALQAAQGHSHYLRNLLAARPEITAWLDAHAMQALSVEQMNDFLDSDATPAARPPESAVASDDDLKRALRSLRQRVMAR
jgi:glutamine synthetase adenylyltransferase